MNPIKLKARALELREAIEGGECETIDTVFTADERKKIKKRWPLIFDLLGTIEEQLAVVNDAQDDLLNQIDMLELVSEAQAIVDQRDFDAVEGDADAPEPEPEIEVVEAVRVSEEE